MKKIYYIAYGSNLHIGQMAHRCPTATIVGTSELINWRLMFKGSKSGNYATIEPCIGESVPVLIWELSESDERSLDRYEGFPVFYFKQTIPVFVNGREIEAMAYLMRLDAKVGAPSLSYVHTLEIGYRDAGFDKGCLKAALSRCLMA